MLLNSTELNLIMGGGPKKNYETLDKCPKWEVIKKEEKKNEKSTSLLRKFLMKQIQTTKPRDWISQVLNDIEKLELDVNIENMKNMKKSTLIIMINEAIKEKTFLELEKKKVTQK